MHKFLVADDHPLFRQALIGALAAKDQQLSVVESGTLEETVAALNDHADIDLLLLDLHMPGSCDLYGLIALREQFPTVPVVVISASEDPGIISRAIGFGASGFIPKSTPPETIAQAIEAILAGDTWVPEETRGSLRRLAPEEQDLANRVASLTPQQYRVLSYLTEGWLNKQIAYELSISEATVKAHITAIFRKLGVQNRTQAVILANQLRLEPVAQPETNS